MNKLSFPNPISIRENIEYLDGVWSFSFNGKDWQDIIVPFSPESKLSGIEYKDFIPVCYYKKTFKLNNKSEKVYINFGAVDYMAQVFINDKYVGSHKGGYSSFSIDVTDFVHNGDNSIYMIVRDDEIYNSARGKQSYKKQSFGCFYTRTTGIWQSVWLEFLPENRVSECKMITDINAPSVTLQLKTTGCGKYNIQVLYKDKLVGESDGEICYQKDVKVLLNEKHLWELGHGRLYDVIVFYEQDVYKTYFGLRTVEFNGYEFLLNGKSVIQKLVLNQGYNPQGVLTYPSVDLMQKDIDLALELGFNGARLHERVFNPRFLYLCDKKGFMVWGEYPSWGIDYAKLDGLGQLISEWTENVNRDFNHPSIVMWCPLNEVWGAWENPDKIGDVKYAEILYKITKILDNTRPCVDVSGGYHSNQTDLYDFHCYEDLDKLEKYLDQLEQENVLEVPLLHPPINAVKYKKGQPVQLSECGGFAFGKYITESSQAETVNTVVLSESAWGYGKMETDGNVFVDRYVKLINLLSKYKKLSGFCYTQLYDIEQEQNGFYYYDRSDKLTKEQKEKIKEANINLGK